MQFEFVPDRKHIPSPLQRPAGECCSGRQTLFIVRTIRNTDTLCGQNAEFYFVKAGGTYSNKWALKCEVIFDGGCVFQ
jgi:hypothetical protein